ncbi:MAG TPA: DUF6236 family protein [Rhodospirillales bacterium]|jgi:hypothetical protein|nr:DUF6236 family protein [Rhodospirillales bacterium]
MGEAKRRKAVEPHFGTVPKLGRGLVVSPPLEVDGSRLSIRSSNIHPQELRFALLFWDRLVWPTTTAFHLASGPNEEFLETCGVLSRPVYDFWGDSAQVIAQAHIRAFLDLEHSEPGAWALAQGESSLLIRDRVVKEGRGVLVELHRAVPVPDEVVPLNDILEFKEKRRGDLYNLRSELEKFYEDVAGSADSSLATRRAVESIGRSCADLIALLRESRFPIRLADLKASFSLRPGSLVAFGAWRLGMVQDVLDAAVVAAASAASSLRFKIGFGLKSTQVTASPYRYVYRFHKEVF